MRGFREHKTRAIIPRVSGGGHKKTPWEFHYLYSISDKNKRSVLRGFRRQNKCSDVEGFQREEKKRRFQRDKT